MQSVILRLQADVQARKAPHLELSQTWKNVLMTAALVLFAFVVGARTADTAVAVEVRQRYGIAAPEGVIELQKVEIDRLKRIHEKSTRFGIPADLAERIEDIAMAEGIEPEVAFGLVRAESEFNRHAVSPVGAVGYTQLMPSTAKYFKRNMEREDLFDRDTNLRIGFRYLKTLIVKYDGNLELALLAYNRGPDRVDQLLANGDDPNNGFVQMVLGKTRRHHR
jgi:soluble lytic murein transglycosylase-like protein